MQVRTHVLQWWCHLGKRPNNKAWLVCSAHVLVVILVPSVLYPCLKWRITSTFNWVVCSPSILAHFFFAEKMRNTPKTMLEWWQIDQFADATSFRLLTSSAISVGCQVDIVTDDTFDVPWASVVFSDQKVRFYHGKKASGRDKHGFT